MNLNLDKYNVNFYDKYIDDEFDVNKTYTVYKFYLKESDMINFFSEILHKDDEYIINTVKNCDVLDAVKFVYGDDYINDKNICNSDLFNFIEIIDRLSYWAWIRDNDQYIYYMKDYIIFVEVQEGLSNLLYQKYIK